MSTSSADARVQRAVEERGQRMFQLLFKVGLVVLGLHMAVFVAGFFTDFFRKGLFVVVQGVWAAGFFIAWGLVYRWLAGRVAREGVFVTARVAGKYDMVAFLRGFVGEAIVLGLGRVLPFRAVMFDFEVGGRHLSMSQMLFSGEEPAREQELGAIALVVPSHPRLLKMLVTSVQEKRD